MLTKIVNDAHKKEVADSGSTNSLLSPVGGVVESMSAMAKFSSMFLEGMTLSARLLDGSSVPIFMEKINIQQA